MPIVIDKSVNFLLTKFIPKAGQIYPQGVNLPPVSCFRKTKECMTHASTKMKRKHQVAIYENKRARGRHKGKGYTIATNITDNCK